MRRVHGRCGRENALRTGCDKPASSFATRRGTKANSHEDGVWLESCSLVLTRVNLRSGGEIHVNVWRCDRLYEGKESGIDSNRVSGSSNCSPFAVGSRLLSGIVSTNEPFTDAKRGSVMFIVLYIRHRQVMAVIRLFSRPSLYDQSRILCRPSQAAARTG